MREILTDRNLISVEIENVLKIIRLCKQANVFQYNESLQKQVKGLPMGSPAPVVLAEITMQKNEKSILVNTAYHVLSWKRYVEDSFPL